ncbi:MAG TPA: response regulator [Patescibacteria group bacterium]
MGKKILVVDDNPHILEAIELILTTQNYEVKTLIKGDNTLSAAKFFLPNLIILDLLLSGEDGREITKALKEDKKTASIPILLISALPSADELAKEAGANAFLAKPFDVSTLLNMVSKIAINGN